MDPDLYDAYLKVNGIVYEDGLTEVEKETLKILESLTDIEKDGDVSVAAAKFEPIRMKIFWTQASVKISYVLAGGRASDTTIRVKASEGASAGMIYTDGIDAGVMSCEGSVNLYLVQDTSLASVEGSDTTTVKIGTYGSSAKKKLTTTGDVIANTLTIEKCTVVAMGKKWAATARSWAR